MDFYDADAAPEAVVFQEVARFIWAVEGERGLYVADVDFPDFGRLGRSAGPVLFCGQLPFLDRSLRTLQIGVVAEDADDLFDDRAVLVYHPGGPGISAVNTLLRDPPAVDLSQFTRVTWDGATASSLADESFGPRRRRFMPGTTESSTHD